MALHGRRNGMDYKTVRKEGIWNIFQNLLVTLLVLLVVFLMLTTKTLSIFADQNTGMIGSGRIALTKGKEDSRMLLTEKHTND